MTTLILVLLVIVYVCIAFEVARRKQISMRTGRKYTSKRRRSFKKKCARLINVLLFRT